MNERSVGGRATPGREGRQDLGSFAPDGSPVEFFRLAPEEGEAEIIHRAVPSGCEILELGCGAGRITHRLIELGHLVVAVDNSADMLAHVHGAETVLGDIEGLDLGRTFPSVILASFLINTPDRAQRRAFLDACKRHVHSEGSVVIQRAHPEMSWVGKKNTERTSGDLRIRTRILEWRGNVFHAVGEYRIGERTWSQEYRSELLDDPAVEAGLAESGLKVERWLDDRREWLQARNAA